MESSSNNDNNNNDEDIEASTSASNIFVSAYSKIIDNLYLSSAKFVTDEFLANLSITHIVNATRTVPLKRNYQTLRVNIIDSVNENIAQHFERVLDFIHTALNQNGTVLVHCISGISRSVTFVIAYLMKYKNMNLKEAFKFVNSKRFIRPNIGFIRQLIDFEKQLFGSNTVKIVQYTNGCEVPDFLLEDKSFSNLKYFYICLKK